MNFPEYLWNKIGWYIWIEKNRELIKEYKSKVIVQPFFYNITYMNKVINYRNIRESLSFYNWMNPQSFLYEYCNYIHNINTQFPDKNKSHDISDYKEFRKYYKTRPPIPPNYISCNLYHKQTIIGFLRKSKNKLCKIIETANLENFIRYGLNPKIKTIIKIGIPLYCYYKIGQWIFKGYISNFP
tara:strand:+ start:3785 stop:4336 length:552 start_codon:yes stop_codon:yes gene_type:complete